MYRFQQRGPSWTANSFPSSTISNKTACVQHNCPTYVQRDQQLCNISSATLGQVHVRCLNRVLCMKLLLLSSEWFLWLLDDRLGCAVQRHPMAMTEAGIYTRVFMYPRQEQHSYLPSCCYRDFTVDSLAQSCSSEWSPQFPTVLHPVLQELSLTSVTILLSHSFLPTTKTRTWKHFHFARVAAFLREVLEIQNDTGLEEEAGFTVLFVPHAPRSQPRSQLTRAPTLQTLRVVQTTRFTTGI